MLKSNSNKAVYIEKYSFRLYVGQFVKQNFVSHEPVYLKVKSGLPHLDQPFRRLSPDCPFSDVHRRSHCSVVRCSEVCAVQKYALFRRSHCSEGHTFQKSALYSEVQNLTMFRSLLCSEAYTVQMYTLFRSPHCSEV